MEIFNKSVGFSFAIAFFVALTGCHHDIWKGDYTIENQVDIDELAGFTTITGNLDIIDTSLVLLTGLEGLTSVGGNLAIGLNDSLTTLTGLEGMTSVGGYLFVRDNDTLCEDRAVDLESQLLDSGNELGSTIENNNGDCL